MADKKKLSDYLTECGMFFFGTAVDETPIIRPLALHMIQGDELYFGVGTHKNVYAQLTANPNVCICATKPDGASWVRVEGAVACDDDPALVDAVWATSPQLKPLYDNNGWTMGVFHLKQGTITYYEHFMTPVATETF